MVMHCINSGHAHALGAAPKGEVINLERLCALDEVGQVKVDDVVANDDVRIRLYDEVPPSLHTLRSQPKSNLQSAMQDLKGDHAAFYRQMQTLLVCKLRSEKANKG